MPHYDYQCQDCGNIFEEFHSMMAEPVKECPECKGKVKKLIGGGSGIIFKGKGFYKTDYRSGTGCENKSESNPACSCCSGSHTKTAH
jgi:putative FmdB family regulatory protein